MQQWEERALHVQSALCLHTCLDRLCPGLLGDGTDGTLSTPGHHGGYMAGVYGH